MKELLVQRDESRFIKDKQSIAAKCKKCDIYGLIPLISPENKVWGYRECDHVER